MSQAGLVSLSQNGSFNATIGFQNLTIQFQEKVKACRFHYPQVHILFLILMSFPCSTFSSFSNPLALIEMICKCLNTRRDRRMYISINILCNTLLCLHFFFLFFQIYCSFLNQKKLLPIVIFINLLLSFLYFFVFPLFFPFPSLNEEGY